MSLPLPHRLALATAFVALACADLVGQTVIEGAGVEDFGQTVVVADFDGDKLADIAIGAPRAAPDGATGAGRVVLVRGAKTLPKEATTAWISARGDHRFGSALLAQDLDGDGRAELVVGAPTAQKLRGAVHLFKGDPGIFEGGDMLNAAASLSIEGEAEPARFGDALAAGDLDGDGLPELVVAAPRGKDGEAEFAGRIFVFAGRKAWTASAPIAVGAKNFEPRLTIVGRATERLGERLLVADLTGDGISDLVVASTFLQNAGRGEAGGAIVVAGRKGLLATPKTLRLAAEAPDWTLAGKGGGNLGATISALDLDGDGRSELLLGEPRRDHGNLRRAGAVFAVELDDAKRTVDLGRAKELEIPALRGAVADEEFGGTLVVAPWTGQPKPELLVGSAAIGRVVVFADPAGFVPPPPPAKAFMPPGSAKGFGTAIGVGDLNGDGKPEVVIGAPGANRIFVY